jgi:hypothetical protein
VRLVVVHDGIQQAIFQRPAVFSFIDEHGQVIVLAVLGPLEGYHLRACRGHSLDLFH